VYDRIASYVSANYVTIDDFELFSRFFIRLFIRLFEDLDFE
jgi:hypothetical protein